MRMVERKCIQCGKNFDISEWRSEHGRGKFCNRICKDDYLKTNPLPQHFKVKEKITRLNKSCLTCKVSKPINDFRKRKTSIDEYEYICRDCANNNYENYKIKNRNKYLARQKVHDAIRRGRIIKAVCCIRCGEITKTEAHHEDYTKPLEVIWLCRDDHLNLHKRKRAGLEK